jgi:hypothetical protein
MSAYPSCKHGHNDPNFRCTACDLETELFSLKVSLGNALEKIDDLQNEGCCLISDNQEMRGLLERISMGTATPIEAALYLSRQVDTLQTQV